MKLKKIASLALAGVMAVSMLAGCSGNGSNNNNNNDDPIVDTSLTGSVIAALNTDTTDTVAFAANSDLQATLEAAVKYVGANANLSEKNVKTALNKIDADLNITTKIPAVYDHSAENDDKSNPDYTTVVVLPNAGTSDTYAVNQIAKLIDDVDVSGQTDATCKALPEQSRVYGATSESDEYHRYNYTYAGDVAVVKVTDAITGQTAYVAAITVARTSVMAEL